MKTAEGMDVDKVVSWLRDQAGKLATEGGLPAEKVSLLQSSVEGRYRHAPGSGEQAIRETLSDFKVFRRQRRTYGAKPVQIDIEEAICGRNHVRPR